MGAEQPVEQLLINGEPNEASKLVVCLKQPMGVSRVVDDLKLCVQSSQCAQRSR